MHAHRLLAMVIEYIKSLKSGKTMISFTEECGSPEGRRNASSASDDMIFEMDEDGDNMPKSASKDKKLR
jgi:hypothetical protein